MIYVTGDMHGDPARLSDPALRRLKKGDILLVCGDFGFIWNNSTAEQKLLRRISRQKYTIAFLDGRHENFDLLSAYPTEAWQGGQAQILNDRLVHLLRGEIYEIEGKSFFTFGGGESDDRDFRILGKSWWPEEMPTEAEMRHGLAKLAARDNQVDYILTHVPARTVAARLNPRAATDGVSLYLGGIEDTVQCRGWFFGSLHRDKAIGSRRRAVFRDVVPIEEAASGKKRG